MSFDLSRVTFNSWNDFLGAVMLQGRPQLDSDWNDQQAEVLRRIQVGTLDTVGQAVYPAALPNSFLIAASSSGGANQIAIGAGRMYVDGILVENHGPSAVSAQGDPVPTSSAAWDTSLAELSNSYPGAPYAAGAVGFTQQPYYPPVAAGITPDPAFTLPATPGPFVAYLDVWQRPVTYIEHPDLVEKAVGVDTTGRLQTVWQVKLLDVSANATPVDCSTPLGDIAAWGPATAPSAGGLTTGVVQSSPSGPCCLTPNTGYTGMENQLYRVEVHAGGGFGTATFKWSRDNASVMTAVTAIAQVTNTAKVTASQLTVDSLGRDEVLGFHVGDWIEILDDYQDLGCASGCLHMIDSINIAAKTITLDALVDTATAAFPVGAQNQTDPSRHTRIRRWDQKGLVLDTNGNTVANVGQAGGPGDIPIPDGTTVIVLENGVTVQFSLNPAGGVFLPGDYWNFAARASDGSVEPLASAPPLGIHHHYARLAVVTFPGPALDCRAPWPAPGSAGGGCGCSVIVGPADVTATNTLQQIVDQFANLETNSVVCLQPGTYTLGQPLRLTAAHSNITLSACQPGTAVLQAAQGQEDAFGDGLIVLDQTSAFTLSGLRLFAPRAAYTAAGFAGLPLASLYPDISAGVQSMEVAIAVRPINCSSLAIENCQFANLEVLDKGLQANAAGATDAAAQAQRVSTVFGAAVFAGGTCRGLRMTGNEVFGGGAFAGFLLAPSVSLSATAVSQPKRQSPIYKFPVAQLPAYQKVAAQPQMFQEAAPAAPQARAPGDVLAGANAGGSALAQQPYRAPVAEQVPSVNLTGIFGAEKTLTNWAGNGGAVLGAFLEDAVFEDNSFADVTVAALVAGEAGAVRFTGNTLAGCNAGMWIVSPSMASLTLFDRAARSTVGLMIAMGYPLPQDDSSTPTTVFAAPAPLRFYTGASTVKDSAGNTWYPDVSAPGVAVSGGRLSQLGSSLNQAIAAADPGESDPELYESERWGTFTYTISNLVPGFYQVTLKFMEIAYTDDTKNKGVRIFDVSINKTKVLSEFDIVAEAGGAYIADDKVFSNIAPVNGQITLSFVGDVEGSDHQAKVSAVEVEAQWDGLVPWPYVAASDFPNATSGEIQDFIAQLAQLGQQGFAGAAAGPLALRADANEMTGLVAPGLLVLAEDQVQNGVVSSLMMSGNRMTALIPAPLEGFDRPGVFFLATASIMLVTRCVVCGNMILNEAPSTPAYTEKNLGPISLLLNSDEGDALNYQAPLPEVSVSGNVFLGVTSIEPPRFAAASGVPPPMNQWNFLNTMRP